MANSNSSGPRGGLSLYANLLNPNASSTISSAPVLYAQAAPQEDASSSKKPQVNAAALRFQPTKRPQIPIQKPKPKQNLAQSTTSSVKLSSPDPSSKPIAAPAIKTTLADWTADDDDLNGFYAGGKRQRGGRKKRKKDKEETVVVQDWDDIYDPSRPNNYEDYRHSEEKVREVREWKDRLYAHRENKHGSGTPSSDEEGDQRRTTNNAFAPPTNYSFAPPPSFDNTDGAPAMTGPAPSPPTAAVVHNDATGEDAYARRMRLSQMNQPPELMAPPPPPPPPSSPPPPPSSAPPQTQPAPAQLAAPPKLPAGTISRAPVRYQLPAAPAEIPASEAELEEALQEESEGMQEQAEDVPRSLRPGQKGFAERLMSKYGWTKGAGLGAAGTGIVNPLRVQVEKRKKKSDAEGGGFVGPAGKGKIVGSKKGGGAGAEGEQGRFGAMSEVVVLQGMVDGMDLDAEVGDGGLMQEIGEECAEKYGLVERVFIHRNTTAASVPVFVKFTSQLSALRAVNALEGRVFNGNMINAKFFDAERFESGIYE